jgi:hypothetical protein
MAKNSWTVTASGSSAIGARAIYQAIGGCVRTQRDMGKREVLLATSARLTPSRVPGETACPAA